MPTGVVEMQGFEVGAGHAQLCHGDGSVGDDPDRLQVHVGEASRTGGERVTLPTAGFSLFPDIHARDAGPHWLATTLRNEVWDFYLAKTGDSKTATSGDC
jgi:hypothetical protein